MHKKPINVEQYIDTVDQRALVVVAVPLEPDDEVEDGGSNDGADQSERPGDQSCRIVLGQGGEEILWQAAVETISWTIHDVQYLGSRPRVVDGLSPRLKSREYEQRLNALKLRKMIGAKCSGLWDQYLRT